MSKSKEYVCPECGGAMEFEDESCDTLVCPSCGNDVDFDHYGLTNEEYDDLYPLPDDDEDDEDEDDCGETYDEVFDELSHRLED